MKKILYAALLSSFLAAPAFAGDNGFYGAVDIQTWNLNHLNGGSNPSTGFRIGGGYNFTKDWGVEVNYASSGNGTLGGLNYKATSLQTGAVDTFHINDIFSWYVKIGLAANKLTGAGTTGCSCSKAALWLPIGVQYNINKQTKMRLEYDIDFGITSNRPAGDISAGYVSLGVAYDF